MAHSAIFRYLSGEAPKAHAEVAIRIDSESGSGTEIFMPSSKILDAVPLSAYRAFSASRLDVLCDLVERCLGARCLSAFPGEGKVDAVANYYALPSSELWFCAYGMPVSLAFEEGDYVRVQFRFVGQGVTHLSTHSCAITAKQACISSSAVTIDFGSGFQQLVWRIKRDVLVRKIAALTGAAVIGKLEFSCVLRLDTPPAAGLTALLGRVLATIARASTADIELVLAELEQMLILSLLANGEHNSRQALQRPVLPAAPWQVRRVEEYLEENLARPFDIDGIVACTGASARSIYRAFHKARGYSPFEFVRRERLLRARELLRGDTGTLTITSVAYACGFSDASRFSKDFAAAFGEPPSVFRTRARVVRRSHRTPWPALSTTDL